MRRIDELKKEIIHEILNSEEYREYRRLQNEIDRIPAVSYTHLTLPTT